MRKDALTLAPLRHPRRPRKHLPPGRGHQHVLHQPRDGRLNEGQWTDDGWPSNNGPFRMWPGTLPGAALGEASALLLGEKTEVVRRKLPQHALEGQGIGRWTRSKNNRFKATPSKTKPGVTEAEFGSARVILASSWNRSENPWAGGPK